MSDKLSGYLLAGTVVLLLLPFIIPVSSLTNQGEDLCVLLDVTDFSPEDECIDNLEVTLDEMADPKIADEPLPRTYTIFALLLAIAALAMMTVPALEGFSNLAPFAALGSTVFSILCYMEINRVLNDFNDDIGMEILEVGFGGYLIALGIITSAAAGVMELMNIEE